MILASAGINRSEIVFQGMKSDFAQRSSELYSRCARADDDKRKPGAAFVGIRNSLRRLKGEQDFVADHGRFFNALQTGSPFAPLIVTEIGALRSSGDDERIIRNRSAILQHDLLRGWIDINGLAQQDTRVLLFAQHAAQWSRYFAGRERSGGNLIKQRLKQDGSCAYR